MDTLASASMASLRGLPTARTNLAFASNKQHNRFPLSNHIAQAADVSLRDRLPTCEAGYDEDKMGGGPLSKCAGARRPIFLLRLA